VDHESVERIGVLGGTFNPVHLGHLLVAQTAADRFELSRVLFIPCARPPHKSAARLLPAQHRYDMLALALEGDVRFEPCDLEVRRGGCSYTVDTARELRESLPGRMLYFILGVDSLLELHLWRDIYRLLTLCEFITLGRPGAKEGTIAEEDIQLDAPWSERLLANYVQGRMVDISSSDIRHRVAEGLSIRYLVPPAVEMYIAEHGLYGGGSPSTH